MNLNPLFTGPSFLKSKTLQFRSRIPKELDEGISQEVLKPRIRPQPKEPISNAKKLSFQTTSTLDSSPSPVLNYSHSEVITKIKGFTRKQTHFNTFPPKQHASFTLSVEKDIRMKKNRTMTTIFDGPRGKILHTDFWSNHMKREAVRIGGISAFISFSEKNKRNSELKQIPEVDLPIQKLFHVESSNNLIQNREKVSRRTKSDDLSNELNFIIDRCNHSRELNSKLRQDIANTGKLLKKESKSLFNTSLYKFS